jgi:peptidoglycan/LPS O-acetylase OafA/YrhL
VDFALLQLAGITITLVVAVLAAPMARKIIAPVEREQERRDRILDGLRAVAAVGVVGCHLNQRFVEMSAIGRPPEVGDHVGILGVQMFFALTAFLFVGRALAGSLEPVRFYVGRVYRIVPLYLVVCTIALLVAWWLTRGAVSDARSMISGAIDTYLYGFIKQEPVTFRGLNMLSLIGIAWTLSYEWLFYLLLVPLMYLWLSSRKLSWPMLAMAAALALYSFYEHYDAVIWAFFAPGIIAALVAGRLPPSILFLLRLALLPCVALVIFLPGYWTLLKLVLVTAIFVAVVHGRPRCLEWRPLQVLGTTSYSIYLLQYLVIFPMVQVMYGRAIFASVESRFGLGIAGVISLVGLSALSYRFIEFPWITLAKRRKKSAAGEPSHLDTAPEPTAWQISPIELQSESGIERSSAAHPLKAERRRFTPSSVATIHSHHTPSLPIEGGKAD